MYKGTLVGMIILPSHYQSNQFSQRESEAAFLKKNFVLFLYKSNKRPPHSEDNTSAGDSFTIACMHDPSKVLYDSVVDKLVFT